MIPEICAHLLSMLFSTLQKSTDYVELTGGIKGFSFIDHCCLLVTDIWPDYGTLVIDVKERTALWKITCGNRDISRIISFTNGAALSTL